MDDSTCWHAVQQRDDSFDGAFVYAVKTTGVYCRPTCTSRRPLRKNVTFFPNPDAAEDAGYRPCKRCQPNTDERQEQHTALMVRVCRHIENSETIPTLDQLGAHFSINPQHLQRTFKRVVGISPRQYADAHRQGRLKALLKAGNAVTDAIYAAGYGSSSRVYENTDDTLGMTPIHYRDGGDNMDISYTIVPCKLGYLLVAATERGIAKISLGDDVPSLADDLKTEFPKAALIRDTEQHLSAWVDAIVGYMDGEQSVLDLPLDIQATSFQRRVWEALRTIPYGETRTYSDLADMIGQPTAARAVASACATNPVAMAIPCHRIVRKNGDLSGYRWGLARKEALLKQEAK